MTRARAVRLVIAVGVVMGLPSAVSLQVFENQDWVWGLALMISGLFIAVAAIRYDVDRFRADMVDTRRADPAAVPGGPGCSSTWCRSSSR